MKIEVKDAKHAGFTYEMWVKLNGEQGVEICIKDRRFTCQVDNYIIPFSKVDE